MSQKVINEFAFKKENYILLLIGIAVLIVGYLLMSGGGSEDPYAFTMDIFSTRRITIAPMVVLSGYGLVLYAIFKKPKSAKAE